MAYWTVARCAEGHLFETPYVTGMSFKSIRLGSTRFMRCPVGGHWSRVHFLNDADITDDQRQEAEAHRTSSLP